MQTTTTTTTPLLAIGIVEALRWSSSGTETAVQLVECRRSRGDSETMDVRDHFRPRSASFSGIWERPLVSNGVMVRVVTDVA